MNTKNIISTLLIVLTFLFLISCSVEQVSVNFKVLSTGDIFNGYYVLDGGYPIEFTSEINGTNLFWTEKTLEIDKQIIISAWPVYVGNVTNVTSLEVQVWEDGELKAEKEDLDKPVGTVQLTYRLDGNNSK